MKEYVTTSTIAASAGRVTTGSPKSTVSPRHSRLASSRSAREQLA